MNHLCLGLDLGLGDNPSEYDLACHIICIQLETCTRPYCAPAPRLLRIRSELIAGQRFAEAMKNLRESLGPCFYSICDILICADRDGLPITSVLDQLSFHAHQERRRLREIEAKELPVRMLFPLVCCILPSFVLLAMVPLLVNSLTVVTAKLL